MSTSELLKSPGVSWVLFLYTYTMLLALGYTASKHYPFLINHFSHFAKMVYFLLFSHASLLLY